MPSVSVCVLSGVECMCQTETDTRAAARKRDAHVRSTPKDTRCQYSRKRKKKKREKKTRDGKKKKERKNSVTYHKFIDFFLISFRFFFRFVCDYICTYVRIYGMSSETFMANVKKRRNKNGEKNV